MEIICFDDTTGDIIQIGSVLSGYQYFKAQNDELFGDLDYKYDPHNYETIKDISNPKLVKKQYVIDLLEKKNDYK